MTLSPGFHPVPNGYIATTVTDLEMWALPKRPLRPAALVRLDQPDLVTYRRLFRAVGEDWMWVSRLELNDAELTAILHDPLVEVWVLPPLDRPGGLVELDFRVPGQCELQFFGLMPAQMGQGTGRGALDFAVDRAFSKGVKRFHLHTCTFDSQRALNVYVSAGFIPTAQRIEIFEDPRLTGGIPRHKAPHVPVID